MNIYLNNEIMKDRTQTDPVWGSVLGRGGRNGEDKEE
jgi:hypothetical protein